jgi:glycosyltransferase involved in cell wall biosynthesis
VLQVDAGREWRGGQNQVRLLCRELRARPDIELLLTTRRDGELARRAAAAGVAIRGVPWTAGLDPRAVTGVAHAIRTLQPDIVHAHDSHALSVLQAARWLAFVGRSPNGRRPRMVATRRVDFPLRRWSAWRRADHVIAISSAVRDVLLAGGVSPAAISIVPSGIDADEVRRSASTPFGIRRRLGLPAGTPLAVNIAALVPHKDQRTLVRAAAAARAAAATDPTSPAGAMHWIIAGDGELRASLEAQTRALGVSDRVHFLGHIEQADALIAEADVFVMSSRLEGLGSVVLHALALGVPVVATAGGGLREIVPPEQRVEVGDAPGLARGVVAAIGRRGDGRLPRGYSAAEMAGGVLDVYRALV